MWGSNADWWDLYRRWLDVLFWWVPKRNDETGQAADRRDTSAAMAKRTGAEDQSAWGGRQSPRQPERGAGEPDDLTALKGIGATTQTRLQSLGIRTYHDLAAADAAEILAALKTNQPMLTRERVQEWIDAARRRTEGA